MDYLRQTAYQVRCEWGLHGLNVLRDISDVIIIVDVLSFTTAIDIALSRQATVYPFAGKGEDAKTFAQEHNAILAKKRPAADGESQFTLSPSSLQGLPIGAHVVLPSPNGSTLSTATGKTPTLAGCLRNAQAVAQFALSFGTNITVIPSGERFIYSPTDSALRPSLEDWIGAGAIISYLDYHLHLSPEAQTAKYVFDAYRDQLQNTLKSCSSGVELISKGYEADVELASQLNISSIVPQLIDGAYQVADTQ